MFDEELTDKAGDEAKDKRYEGWSTHDLQKKAEEVGIEGRSDMNKDELIEALRDYL